MTLLPYLISWEPRGVVWTYRGVVTGEEILESNQRIYGDERFDALLYEIVDLTAVDSFDVTEDDMAVIAANDAAAALSNPNVRVAVAVTDERMRELSHAYERFTSPWPQEIFPSITEARRWAVRNAG